jgi:parallel beta-helix repeat protein
MSLTKRNKFLIIILMISVFLSMEIVFSNASNEMNRTRSRVYISDAILGSYPITITSDAELDQFMIDYSLNGSGTIEDPYVLNYTTFEFSFDLSTVGIHIENITKYLVIQDIILTNTNSTDRGTGIEIFTDNVRLYNITVENTITGISLQGNNLTVNQSVIGSRVFGLKAIDCDSLNLLSTNITGADYGVYFESCVNCNLTKNEIKNGKNGIQMYGCSGFRLERNLIEANSEIGVLIIEHPTQTGLLTVLTNNRFVNNGLQAKIVTNDIHTLFYDPVTKEGNYWSDWRRWGDYKIQDNVFDPFPMRMINIEGDLEVAPRYPFKFWFWIFAPTLVVLGLIGYFLYWKLIVQPTKE